jgi:hypothetical protein
MPTYAPPCTNIEFIIGKPNHLSQNLWTLLALFPTVPTQLRTQKFHRFLLTRLSLQVIYLWRHVSSTAPPFILWWTNLEILFGPLHRSSPFIGELRCQAIQMERGLYETERTQNAVYIVRCLWKTPSHYGLEPRLLFSKCVGDWVTRSWCVQRCGHILKSASKYRIFWCPYRPIWMKKNWRYGVTF